MVLLVSAGGGCANEASNGGGSARSGAASDVPGLQPAPTTSAPVQTGVPPQTVMAGTGTVAGAGPMQTGEAGAGGVAGDATAVTAGVGGDDGTMMDPVVAGDGMAGSAGDAMAGAGGAGTDVTTPPSLDTCPQPPADAAAMAVEAWTIVNELRLAAGAGCMNFVPELVASAQAHCDYRTVNSANASCLPDGHTEVESCTGFTGRTVGEREIAAGYPRALAYTEVYVSYGSPGPAIQSWIETVYHRIPLLDPWTADMGYGGATGCDVIDIGRGTSTVPADAVVVYPYDGQTDVPPSWSGLEGPQPPAPPSGWPSSPPINIFAQEMNVTEHVLTRDGDATPLEHLWLDANSPEIGSLRSYFRNTSFLYGAALDPNTTYRVRIAGTYVGGTLDEEWTFTTGAARRF